MSKFRGGSFGGVRLEGRSALSMSDVGRAPPTLTTKAHFRAVDHAADKAEFLHGALELDRRCIWRLQWQAGKAGKSPACQSRMVRQARITASTSSAYSREGEPGLDRLK
jgi:hypothetical protein